MVARALQLAKHALVSSVLSLARQYAVVLSISRDSPDKLVLDGFRKVAKKAHPDKGGSKEDMRKLNEARELWEKASKTKPPRNGGQSDALAAVASKTGFRICSTGKEMSTARSEETGCHSQRRRKSGVKSKGLRGSFGFPKSGHTT